MSRTATATVDLDDFDDDDILDAARDIAASRGESLGGRDAEQTVRDITAAIVNGRSDEALILLERLVATEPRLVAAIETGRRRVQTRG